LSLRLLCHGLLLLPGSPSAATMWTRTQYDIDRKREYLKTQFPRERLNHIQSAPARQKHGPNVVSDPALIFDALNGSQSTQSRICPPHYDSKRVIERSCPLIVSTSAAPSTALNDVPISAVAHARRRGQASESNPTADRAQTRWAATCSTTQRAVGRGEPATATDERAGVGEPIDSRRLISCSNMHALRSNAHLISGCLSLCSWLVDAIDQCTTQVHYRKGPAP